MTEALERFESGDMALARGGFNGAATELEESVDHFRADARQRLRAAREYGDIQKPTRLTAPA